MKSKAVAVIFYRGTGLNNNGNTTTERTLGVGLKHNKDGMVWSSGTAKDTEITQIMYNTWFNGNAPAGDNLDQIHDWLTSDIDTDDESKYQAFYYGRNYASEKIGSETVSRISSTSELSTNWYLPTYKEFAALHELYFTTPDTFKTILQSIGSDTFDDCLYWTASEGGNSAQLAVVIDFAPQGGSEIGSTSGSIKSDPCYYTKSFSATIAYPSRNMCVCAIREF